MKIDFHVPTGRAKRLAPNPDIRIIKNAIDSPTVDLDNQVAQLKDAVYLIRHCRDLDPHQTLDKLAEIDQAVHENIVPQLQRRRIGLSLPLSDQNRRLYELTSSLFGQMTKTYQRLIRPDAKNANRAHLAQSMTACYGALAYLSNILDCAYQAYQTVPQGVWLKIHNLYDVACGLGIQDEHIIKHSSCPTVTHLYKRAILLGLSNPYRFPFRTIQVVDDYVSAELDKVRLTYSASRESNQCFFVVDPALDRPAIPMLPRLRASRMQKCRILDTVDVSGDLSTRIQELSLQSKWCEGKPTVVGLSDFEQLELFKTLLIHWGRHPIRTKERTRVGSVCDLAIGLGAVTYVLNGFKSFEVFDEHPELYSEDNVIKGTFGQQKYCQKNNFSLSNDWTVSDESHDGVRLTQTTPADFRAQIRVGELVALKCRDQNEWKIGVVRWATSRNGKTFEIGIYHLGSNRGAFPVSVKPVQLTTESAATYSLAVLLASPDRGLKTLVVHKGVYQPHGSVLVKVDHSERVCRVRKLLLSTRAFDCFAVQFDQTKWEEALRFRLPA